MTEERLAEQFAELQKQELTLQAVSESGLLEHVAHVSDRTIFAERGAVEERRAAMVKVFGPDELHGYYVGADGTLAMRYEHATGMVVVYFDDDVDGRLAKLSDGKCRIETVTRTEQQVVCDTEGGNDE